MQKQFLSFRFSRKGWVPDTLILQRTDASAEACRKQLEHDRRIAHYHISPDGTVTALAPISCAARPEPMGDGYPYRTPACDDRRGIFFLIQTDSEPSAEQSDQLNKTVARLKEQLYRTYGVTDGLTMKDETRTSEAEAAETDRSDLFRVQTGCYARRRDAEESLDRLRAAGLAGYITRVRKDGTEELL